MGIRGERKNGDGPRAFVCSHVPQKREPVFVGHGGVRDDDIRDTPLQPAARAPDGVCDLPLRSAASDRCFFLQARQRVNVGARVSSPALHSSLRPGG